MSEQQTSKPVRQGPTRQPESRQMSELEVLVRARYPLLYVMSWEEQRLVRHVLQIASRLGKKVYEWSITTGLIPAGTSVQLKKSKNADTQDPLVALDKVIEDTEPALYVFKDFHPFLKCSNMAIIRRLRDVAASMQNTYKTIIIVSPMFELPPDLEKDLTVVDFGLPREPEFSNLLTRIIEEVKENPKLNVQIAPKTRERIVHALLGLTLSEAENVLAKSLVTHRGLGEKSLSVIHSEKQQIIRKSGLLEYYKATENMNYVGGLDSLKSWLLKRSIAFSDRARRFGLPAPKGILLLGVQGCGKSLMAKTVSNTWQLPLLRFDVGRVFGSLVGSSEQNIRRAMQVAESVAPVVLWIDEIDKAFRASRGSASSDGGTSARVFGTFLTWLSEKQDPVFVVATANDVTMLPPELLRKGRFDEIFFVDLPTAAERREIFRIHLARRRLDAAAFDLDALAQASLGYSGAEIEESIVSALFDAFYHRSKLTTLGLVESIRQAVPLSKTMSEDVDGLRQWAEARARPATTPAPMAVPDAVSRSNSTEQNNSPDRDKE